MTADGVVVRVSVKTAPMEQWAIARALREQIKARFDHEGIKIPHTRYVEFVPDPVGHRDVDPDSEPA